MSKKFICDTSEDVMENGQLINRKTYYLSELKLPWIEAFLTCRSFGFNLWHFETREEWDNMSQIYRNHESLFDWHNYIGATRVGKETWYWSHSGEPLDSSLFDWGVYEPNHPDEEFCSDITWQNNKITLNDVPCRAHHYLFKFLCVDNSNRKNQPETEKAAMSSSTKVLSSPYLLVAVMPFFLRVYQWRR
jgi:hypothetical protein